MKKELTERSIENYLDYLVSIRLCYGENRCAEHFKRVINGAKDSFSSADVKKLKSELLHRIDSEYEKQLLILKSKYEKRCNEDGMVKHGKWMPVEPDSRGFTFRFTCSVCGGYTTYYEDASGCDYDYCPNCGAKMDLEE